MSRISTPVTTEMARTDSRATAATPSGMTRSRAPRAHDSDRQAMSRGPWAKLATGSEKLVTSKAPGISPGENSTRNGAATTAMPKPMDDCTNAPASTTSPNPVTSGQSIRGTRGA